MMIALEGCENMTQDYRELSRVSLVHTATLAHIVPGPARPHKITTTHTNWLNNA